MRNLSFKFAAFTAMAMLLSLSALAEVKVVLNASKIVQANGTEQKQSADKARPGEVIEYVADYKNTDTKGAARGVVANLPIPPGMEFIPQSANPSQVMATTDDLHFAAVPLKRSVKRADGKVVEELVPYSEYRSLRWNLGDLAAGATKSVKARMKVKTQNK